MSRRPIYCLIITAILLAHAISATAQLPAPNHPIMFGYYYADGRYTDMSEEVWGYTDTYVAIPCGYADVPEVCDEHQAFKDSLAKQAAAGRKIFLLTNREDKWDWIISAAAPYWDRVKIVESLHESDQSAADTDAAVVRLKELIHNKGLDPRPVSVMYSADQALTTNGIFAPNLDVVGIETYMFPRDCVGTPDCPNGASCIEKMNCRLEQAKARVPANKKIVIVTMAFDRRANPPPAEQGWVNDIPTLTALQDPPYLKAYNDPRVIGIFPFAYARHRPDVPLGAPGAPQGATRDYPTLQARHQDQGAQLMRWMSLDAPASGVVTQPFLVGGWAVDQAAISGCGVDTIHVWAVPTNGNPAIFVGVGTPIAGSRPDVAAVFGLPRFGDSGFNVIANGLPAGTYTLIAFAHSTVTNTFTHSRSVTITVPSPAMNIDLPSNGGLVLQYFWVGGWAIDPAAASGTGVDTVHVWALPSSGPNIFLGANYGVDRPDVGAAYGSSRFNLSGFNVLGHLSPGTYTIAAFGHSTVTNTFNQVKTVNITVQ